MIAEKLPLRFDVELLKSYFLDRVVRYSPINQGPHFRGWSILSGNGDYKDGMQYTGHYYSIDEAGHQVFDFERAQREIGYKLPREHVNPTQVATDYVSEMIRMVRDYNLFPHRARWIMLMAGGETVWHRDAIDDEYSVRLHIPIITNPGCLFSTDEGSFHMPADGHGYLVAVNRRHMAANAGTENRVHIIMDVIDEKGVTEHHRLSQHKASWK